MAEYDLDAVAEAAVENALQLLPPVSQLMKLTYHDMLKLIIRAAAPTIEEAYWQWLLVELSEAGIMVDLEKLKRHFDGTDNG